MSGRGSTPGLFGIVGGLLWGAPRNLSPSNEMEEEVVIVEDRKKSPQVQEDMPNSTDLESHENSVVVDIIDQDQSVDMPIGTDGEQSGTEDSASRDDSDVDENEEDVDTLTYEGELIIKMSYRTMQLHLKAMGIKCTGKKAQLLKSLQAAVQSGSADRLRSLRHASPMHPYPHENARTPKRKRLSSPTVHSQTQSSPASTRITRLRSENGRRTMNSTGLVMGRASRGDGSSKVKSKRLSARTSDVDGTDQLTPSVAAPVGAASARMSSKKIRSRTRSEAASSTKKKDTSPPMTSPKVYPLPPPLSQEEKEVTSLVAGADSDSEPYFSSEECSPVQRVAISSLTNGRTGSAVQLAVVGSRMLYSVGTTDDQAILSSAPTGGGSTIVGKGAATDDSTTVMDSLSAMDTVSVAATVGSIAEDDRNTIDLCDLAPPQPFLQDVKVTGRAYGSLGYDDDRSSAVSFADQPLRPSRRSDISVLPSGGLTPPVRNALDAIGHRFIEMLKGEGPELTEAEFAIYQSLLESKRKGVSAVADSASLLSAATPSSTSSVAPIIPTDCGTASSQVDEAEHEAQESDKENMSLSTTRPIDSDHLSARREGRKVHDARMTFNLRDGREEYFGSAPQSRKRTVADADLLSTDWGRASTSSVVGSLQDEEDVESQYSQQGRHKRQYRGDPFEPPVSVGYMDAWPDPSYRGSTEGCDRMSILSAASSQHPEQYSPREYQESYGHSQWQQDRQWMALRRHSFIPPQPQQNQSHHTPRFQENGSRMSESGFRGYGLSANSGMAPISLQVQQHRSLTPGMSSVQRRLMKRRVAGASASSRDGSYTGSYGTSRAASATASGAVAKRILDTLGDITTSLDEQRRKPLPTATSSVNTLSVRDSAGTSTETAKGPDRFSTDIAAGQYAVRKVGFATTPSSSNSTSNALKNRKATPHGAMAGVNASYSATSSISEVDDNDTDAYDDRRASTCSDQLWSRDTGRGLSVSPPVPSGKRGWGNPVDGSSAIASAGKDTDESENEFMFDSPTHLEGIDENDLVQATRKASVRFAFSPPGKKRSSKQQIGQPLTPGIALRGNKPTSVVSEIPKMSTVIPPTSGNVSDRSEDTATPKNTGFSESIWKRPNTVQCKVCLVYNDEKSEKCVSCESKMGTAADTSRRPSASAASAVPSSSTDGAKSTFGSLGGSTKAVSAAGSKSAIGSAGFSFGTKPAAKDCTSTEDTAKKPSVNFGAPVSGGAGFTFSSTTGSKADSNKEPLAAKKKTEVSSATSAGTSETSIGADANPPTVSVVSVKKFSGFGLSIDKRDSVTTITASSSDAEEPSAVKPIATLSSVREKDCSNVATASTPKLAFGFSKGKPSVSESTPTPTTTSFGLNGAEAPSASSGLEFNKKIAAPASSGFSFGGKRASDGPSIEGGSHGRVDDNDEGRGRKRVNADDAAASTPAAKSAYSFGKTPSSFGSSSTAPAAVPNGAPALTASLSSSSSGGAKPSFGFLTSTATVDSSTEANSEAAKPSSEFAFKTSAPTPAAHKAASTSFQFGSTATSDKPTASTSFSAGVKGPFGTAPSVQPALGSSSSTSTMVSGPFGGSGAAVNATKPSVTGVFGSGGSSGSSSSFKFSPAGTGAPSAGVNFKFGEKKAASTAPGATASVTAPAATTNFKGFGGFSTASSTPAKEAAPPPPYGSESPGSGMDTGYASGDASNMSTGALPPLSNQSTSFSSSSFGSFGGGSGFGSAQSMGGGTVSTFGGSNSFGGGSTGFSMGATAKPASFGGSAQSSNSFSFKPSVGSTGGSSFGSGGASGGIAFGQGPSSLSQQSGTAAPSSGGFSLGSTDKKQPAGRRKLKAKKFT